MTEPIHTNPDSPTFGRNRIEASNESEQTRPAGRLPDTRKNLKKAESPERAISRKTLEIVSDFRFSSPKKFLAANLNTAFGKPKSPPAEQRSILCPSAIERPDAEHSTRRKV